MDDLISRQAAIDVIMQKPAWHSSDGSYYHSSDIRQALESLSSTQQKKLKYSGESICNYCITSDCTGCVYEPMERGDE